MSSMGGRTWWPGGLCLGLALWLGASGAFPSAGSAPPLLGEWRATLPRTREDVAAALAEWMNALRALGRYVPRTGCRCEAGNDLFVPARPGHEATVYISGVTPWKKLYTNDHLARTGARCCTMAHLVLGPRGGDQLIRWLTRSATTPLQTVASDLLDRFKACNGAAKAAPLETVPGQKTKKQEDEPPFTPDDLRRLLKKYADGLRAYLRDSGAALPERQLNRIAFSDNGTLAPLDRHTHQILKDFTHTERMFIHLRRGMIPNGLVIYSRFSMCKSCEPAVVQVARNNQVWFISQSVYNESYVAGRTNAPVKKAVVYPSGDALPIGDIWTDEDGPAAYNDPNPNDTTVFGGETWLAVLPKAPPVPPPPPPAPTS